MLIIRFLSLGLLLAINKVSDANKLLSRLKRDNLSAVESTIGLLKERLQSKGLILDNIEYNLNDSGEHSNLGKHNHADKENKHIKHTYNNEKQSESSEGNDKFHDNKILRHDNGTIIEKYI